MTTTTAASDRYRTAYDLDVAVDSVPGIITSMLQTNGYALRNVEDRLHRLAGDARRMADKIDAYLTEGQHLNSLGESQSIGRDIDAACQERALLLEQRTQLQYLAEKISA